MILDPRFNDKLVTRFVNMMMLSGKKSVAFKVFYDAIDIIDSKKTDDEKSRVSIDLLICLYGVIYIINCSIKLFF